MTSVYNEVSARHFPWHLGFCCVPNLRRNWTLPLVLVNLFVFFMHFHSEKLRYELKLLNGILNFGLVKIL